MALGRFKSFLKERCPECGRILEVRTEQVVEILDGEEVSYGKDYVACSNNRVCGYERKIEQKRIRREVA